MAYRYQHGNIPIGTPPKYHRQRLLLFLLEQAGGCLTKRDIQKLLFLYVQDNNSSHYSFVPFRYGCYSFLAADDMDLLCKRGWIEELDSSYRIRTSLAKCRWARESYERRQVGEWIEHNPLRGMPLVRDVYLRFPYYAGRSEIRDVVLGKSEIQAVEGNVDSAQESRVVLYTIGYEGLHFEEYMCILLDNNIKLLCDVRRNPLSRKYGFSKGAMSRILPKFGIDYEHIPELGIPSSGRQNLHLQGQRHRLFVSYKKNLESKDKSLDRLSDLLNENGRIALTCFERESSQCHRHCISDCLSSSLGVEVIHL